MASIGQRKMPPEMVGRNEACEAEGREVSTGAPYFLVVVSHSRQGKEGETV